MFSKYTSKSTKTLKLIDYKFDTIFIFQLKCISFSEFKTRDDDFSLNFKQCHE